MSREERKKRWGFWEWFRIGSQENPMLDRLRLLQTPWFGVYLHFIHREDLDPVPHDHPWNFHRIVLRGWYLEQYFTDPIEGEPELRMQRRWVPGYIPVDHAHRITTVAPKTVTLVLVGKKQRTWGFWTPEDLSAVGDGYGWESRKWIDYRDYLGLRPSGPMPDNFGMTKKRAAQLLGPGPDARILEILTEAVPPAPPGTDFTPPPIEEAIRRARSALTEGCKPMGCSCMGHSMPGVRHMVPCCDTPHIDQMGLASVSDVPPSAS